MLGIARRRVLMMELTLKEIKASRGLHMHPAFGDPMMLAFQGKLVHPGAQLLRRWLIYFPLAWITNIFNPLTWFFTLPTALFISL